MAPIMEMVAGLALPRANSAPPAPTVTTNGFYKDCTNGNGMKAAVVDYANGIYVSIDGGATWTLRKPTGTSAFTGTACSADGSVLALLCSYSAQSRWFISYDFGTTWFLPVGVPGNPLAISADGTKLVTANFPAGNYVTVSVSTDSGATWTASNAIAIATTGNGRIPSVAMSSDGVRIAMIAVTYNNDYYTVRSIDGGATWSQHYVPTTVGQIAYIAGPSNLATLFATATSNKIYKSTDLGNTWALAASGNPTAFTGLACSDDGLHIVAGDVGTTHVYSSDGGATWASVVVPDAGTQGSSTISNDGLVVYHARYNGHISRSTDGGSTWTILYP